MQYVQKRNDSQKSINRKKGRNDMPGYKRELKPGLWSLEIQLPGKDAKGKYRRASKRFHGTAAQAERELQRWYNESRSGGVAPAGTMTVEDLCRAYIQHTDQMIERGELHRSYSRYRDGIINKWVAPAIKHPGTKIRRLGDMRVNRITPQILDRLKDDMAAEGLTGKSINNSLNLLSKLFRFAVTDLHVLQSSPVDLVSKAHVEMSESRGYTLEEFDKILKTVLALPPSEQHYKVAYLIALFGGLRLSEVCALEEAGYDSATGRIHVTQARQWSPGRGIVTDRPKSKAGVRYVTLPREVTEEIDIMIDQQEEQAAEMGEEYHETPYLIKRPDHYAPAGPGDPVAPHAVSRRFKKVLRDAGVDLDGRKPFHALRHTHASILKRLGTSTEDMREQLGHAQLTTTLNIYTHSMGDREQRIAGTLSAAFKRGNDENDKI